MTELKIVFIGGNHPRHTYYLNRINQRFPVAGAIIEKRSDGTNEKNPIPPDNISEHDKQNFVKHFSNRYTTEQKYFGNEKTPDCNLLEIEKNELNGQKTVDFINSIKPDIVLIYGSHLIKEPLYSQLPENTINLHGGLSPRYRGTATMFWPFYFLEPNYVGTTFHYIISEPDAGTIIHQSVPTLEIGDKIHDVSCKTIIQSSKDVVKLLEIFEKKGKWGKFSQKGTGKNFLERDFRPEHLRIIYDYFDDNIVDKFLEGELKSREPELIKQF